MRYYDLSGGRQNVTAGVTRAGLDLAFDGLGERFFLVDVIPGRKVRRGSKAVVVSARSDSATSDLAKAFLKFK